MSRLRRLLEKPSRLVVGLMSGTSLDGVDAVAVAQRTLTLVPQHVAAHNNLAVALMRRGDVNTAAPQRSRASSNSVNTTSTGSGLTGSGSPGGG